MKIKKDFIITFSIISLLCVICLNTCDSFVTGNTLTGAYVYNKQFNTSDSLFIHIDGIYTQKIYNEFKVLVYENTNKWECSSSNGISFHDFMPNEDAKIPPQAVLDERYLMNYMLNKEKCFGDIKLRVDYDLDLYYLKVN